MPTFPPAPVDIDCLLRIAQGRRRTMRARCPGDRFRAAMAVLKQEKDRMRGKWSLDSVYEWPDDGDDTPCAPPKPAPSASLPPVPQFVNPPGVSRWVGPAPELEPQFNRTVLHFPDAGDDDRTPPPGPLPVPERGCSTGQRGSDFSAGNSKTDAAPRQRDPLEHPLSIHGEGAGGWGLFLRPPESLPALRPDSRFRSPPPWDKISVLARPPPAPDVPSWSAPS